MRTPWCDPSDFDHTSDFNHTLWILSLSPSGELIFPDERLSPISQTNLTNRLPSHLPTTTRLLIKNWPEGWLRKKEGILRIAEGVYLIVPIYGPCHYHKKQDWPPNVGSRTCWYRWPSFGIGRAYRQLSQQWLLSSAPFVRFGGRGPISRARGLCPVRAGRLSPSKVENSVDDEGDNEEEGLKQEEPCLSEQDEALTEGEKRNHSMVMHPTLLLSRTCRGWWCLIMIIAGVLAILKTRTATRHRAFLAREPHHANSMQSIAKKAIIAYEKGPTSLLRCLVGSLATDWQGVPTIPTSNSKNWRIRKGKRWAV
jgi:hypothetical protein